MQPGLVSITFRQLSPDEVIAVTLESGLRGIEWGGDVHVPHGDLETARQVGAATRAAGLEVASYGSYYRFAECDPGAEGNGPSMESVLDSAEALGAPAIRLWAGHRGPADTPRETFQAIVARARAFAEAATRRGMRIDFEFHEGTLTETPASTIELLKAVNHPAARTLWQPPLQTSPEKRLAGLRVVLPWVSNLHCNHFAQDPWPEIHPLGDGTGEWSAYLREANASARDGWILLEHVRNHSVACFREDARTLRSWLTGSALL